MFTEYEHFLLLHDLGTIERHFIPTSNTTLQYMTISGSRILLPLGFRSDDMH